MQFPPLIRQAIAKVILTGNMEKEGGDQDKDLYLPFLPLVIWHKSNQHMVQLHKQNRKGEGGGEKKQMKGRDDGWGAQAD